MLNIEILKKDNIFRIEPQGKLGKSDFKSLKSKLDSYINEHDKVPSLVIHANGFPRWKKFSALLAHVRFVRGAQSYIPKVAFVTDAKLLSVMPVLARYFVKAKVRRFEEEDMDEAMAWARAAGDHPGRYRLLKGFPNDVIAIEAEGVITAQDYEDVLVPLVAEKRKRHDKLKMLIVLDDDFQGWSAGAMWEDTKFGLKHLTDLSRIAVVSDIGWMRHAVKIFGPLMPAKVRIFPAHDFHAASEWVKR